MTALFTLTFPVDLWFGSPWNHESSGFTAETLMKIQKDGIGLYFTIKQIEEQNQLNITVQLKDWVYEVQE